MSSESHTHQTTASSQAPSDEQPRPDGALPVRETLITEVHDANRPAWSRRRAVLTGAAVGAFFGVIFFAAYAGTSAWICSARLDCGHWAPITIVSGSGAVAFTLLGGLFGYVLHKTYRLFKVA